MSKMCLGATHERCCSTFYSTVHARECSLQRHRELLSPSLQQVINMLPVEHKGLPRSFCREASAKLFFLCVSLPLSRKRVARLLYFSHLKSKFFYLKKDECILTFFYSDKKSAFTATAYPMHII